MRALALALLVPLVLAGCASPSSEGDVAEAPDVVLVTAENDLSSLQNESFQMQAHQHDYWDGKDALVVLESVTEGDTLFFSEEWRMAFVPEKGAVVPQGTSEVEVTVSWEDGENKRYASPELWVKSAADHEPFLVGPVQSGETLRIPTTLERSDLPHQSLSAWVFQWRIQPPEAPVKLIHWDGTVTMKVVAKRGLEIPVYPPHPDLWGGHESLPLVEDGQGFGVWRGTVDSFNCFGSCPQVHTPANGSIVPYDAALVEVVLEERDPGATRVGLKFHAADAREWVDLTPVETQGKRHTFRIEVGPGMGDSPYATQSLWAFAPYVAGPERDGWHAASYRIEARVLKVA